MTDNRYLVHKGLQERMRCQKVEASLFEAQGNIQKMADGGSSDRTAKQLNELLDIAVITLVKIWEPEIRVLRIGKFFEAVLKK